LVHDFDELDDIEVAKGAEIARKDRFPGSSKWSKTCVHVHIECMVGKSLVHVCARSQYPGPRLQRTYTRYSDADQPEISKRGSRPLGLPSGSATGN